MCTKRFFFNLKLPQDDWVFHGFVALDEETRQKVEGRQSIGNATNELIDKMLADEDNGDVNEGNAANRLKIADLYISFKIKKK